MSLHTAWLVLLRATKLTLAISAGVAAVVGVLAWLRRRDHVVWRAIAAVTIAPWRAIDEDRGPGAATGPRGVDGRVMAILVTAAIALTLGEYYASTELDQFFDIHVIGKAFAATDPRTSHGATAYAWWTAWRLCGYVLLPMLVIAAIPGERVRDYHLSARGVAVTCAALAVAAAAAATYRGLGRGLEPWRFELLYAVQLCGLEWFFRGFLLQGLRRAAGANAIFIAAVPYCMVQYHYHQPLREVIAAIPIAIALGTLAMRTRSIWPGALIMLAAGWLLRAAPDTHGVMKASAALGWRVFRHGVTTGGLIAGGLGAIAAILWWARRRDHLVWRLLRAVSVDAWRTIDTEPGPGTSAEPRRADWRVLVVLATVAVSLTLQEYVGQRDRFETWFPMDPRHPDRYWQLEGFVWWTGWRVFGYVVMPIAVILAMPGERLRDYHVSPRGFFRHLWIYVVLFLAILPAVYLASRTQAFRHTYPFYRLATRSRFDLWTWEAMYAVQFMSLEFFFRGFILQGLRRAIGANAVFVMIVPYCMIHYGKPMPETFGAIGAGLILGTLAMRTRSIWGGVMIHIGVAWSMDLLAISTCPPHGCH